LIEGIRRKKWYENMVVIRNSFSRVFLGQFAMKMLFLLLVTFSASCWWVGQSSAQEGYLLGPEDEIEIRVWDHDDLTRTARVGLDGRISYPFVGELPAQGLTVMQLQKELERRLGAGYIVDPHVSIKVTEFKSQKFFVVGNVQRPGTYPLTKDITVVEAISSAGGMAGGSETKSTAGGGIAIIVRARPGEKLDQPRMPDKVGPKDKVTVSLGAAVAGDPRHNVPIKNGDTVYVPMLMFYAAGEVKKPGRYPYEDGMTVRMAVTTAGGFTDKASPRRTHIIRDQEGNQKKVEVKIDDPIRPGDTLVVPESWF
jgi:polysaccharide export outer membrane protein